MSGSASEAAQSATAVPHLKRVLSLWDLILIGIVIVQPIAPMGIFGVVNNEARGHVVTTILIAMVAMLFTAISYGKMARAYPSAGSAYTYVGREIHPALGYVTGWAMVMDYVLNPLICTVLCSKLTQNILPGAPYWALAIAYAALFTGLNLRAGGFFLFHLVNFTILIANVGSGMGAQLAAARLLYGMGRGAALPQKFFGPIEAKRRIPRNNVVLIGAIALAGAFFVSYERGAELLNFGAFIAFMGVNLAAFARYFLRADEKRWTNLTFPLLGFAICFFIWLNLSRPAKIAGAAWMLVGVVYGAARTKGFREDLVRFEMPEEEA